MSTSSPHSPVCRIVMACSRTSATSPPVTGAYLLALRDNSNATACRSTAAAMSRSAGVGNPRPVAAHHAVVAAANRQSPSPGTRTTAHCRGSNTRWLGGVSTVLLSTKRPREDRLESPKASRWSLGAPRASRRLEPPRASRRSGAPKASCRLEPPKASCRLGAPKASCRLGAPRSCCWLGASRASWLPRLPGIGAIELLRFARMPRMPGALERVEGPGCGPVCRRRISSRASAFR